MDVTYLIPNANFGNASGDTSDDNFNQYTDNWSLTKEKMPRLIELRLMGQEVT